MNFDSIPYEANTGFNIEAWSGKSYANKLKAGHVFQTEWDMGSLGVLGNDFLSIGPVPSKSLNGSNSVDKVGSDQSVTAEKQERTEPDPLDHDEMPMKVDFFRKLGYSSEEISVVLQKLGLNADTNALLGELVKHGAGAADKEAVPEGPPEYCLVPRGGGSAPSPAPAASSEENESEQFKPVVIDGSNVAMSHGNKEVFSCLGISLAVNWFLDRGHTDITVFVPSWRKEQPRPDVPITDQNILRELEKQKILVFTPSRRVGGKRVVCYDDRFIVKLAYESDGIVVSNDTYRDLQNERPEWKKFIEERLLMYSFVNDKFMPPDDPLGRHGPSLDNFLRKKAVIPEHKKPQCPYGKKCTYGIKCKFYHPERVNQLQRSVADELRANARQSPTKSTAGAQKEEKKSRKPSHADLALAPPADADKAPVQKMSVERRNSSHKGTAFMAEGSARGSAPSSVSSHSSGYGSSDWHPPPHMDSIPYTSQDCLDAGYASFESQMADMWNCRSSSYSEPSHHEHMGSCGYCSCGRERQAYQPSRSAEHDAYHHRSHQQPPHRHQDFHKPIATSCSGSSFLPYVQDQPHGRSSQISAYSVPGFVRPEHQPPVGTRSLPGEYHPASMHSQYYSEPHQYNLTSSPTQYCSEPPQMSHQSRARVPRQLHSSNGPSSQWPQQDSLAKERSSARTKLCGIFNPHLVDTVMNLHPHLTDPQRLAAEIFTYKTQHPGI